MQRIDDRSLVAAEKPELTVLPTPELNAETPAHLLDDDITPADRLFVRNTGFMPGFFYPGFPGFFLPIFFGQFPVESHSRYRHDIDKIWPIRTLLASRGRRVIRGVFLWDGREIPPLM